MCVVLNIENDDSPRHTPAQLSNCVCSQTADFAFSSRLQSLNYCRFSSPSIVIWLVSRCLSWSIPLRSPNTFKPSGLFNWLLWCLDVQKWITNKHKLKYQQTNWTAQPNTEYILYIWRRCKKKKTVMYGLCSLGHCLLCIQYGTIRFKMLFNLLGYNFFLFYEYLFLCMRT